MYYGLRMWVQECHSALPSHFFHCGLWELNSGCQTCLASAETFYLFWMCFKNEEFRTQTFTIFGFVSTELHPVQLLENIRETVSPLISQIPVLSVFETWWAAWLSFLRQVSLCNLEPHGTLTVKPRLDLNLRQAWLSLQVLGLQVLKTTLASVFLFLSWGLAVFQGSLAYSLSLLPTMFSSPTPFPLFRVGVGKVKF